jgi:hypothetical protein
MSLKKTAEDLLKIAEDIEMEAAEVTQFVCEKCNHTTTLAKINASRKEAANEIGDNVVVSPITVNEKVTCPACDGVLAYNATEESAPYYFDEKKAEEDDKDKEEKEATKEPSQREINEETRETPAEQALEEKGEKLHKEPHAASIDYDKLDLYLKGK